MSRIIRNATKVALIAATAIAIPALGALPAQAHTSSGCTVEPLKPTFAGFNSNGTKLINYRVSVSCSSGRTVQIEQKRYEEDGFLNPDDYLGTTTFNTSGVRTLDNVRTLVDTELGNEEVYQQIRFRVTANGVTSPWTGTHKSAVLDIAN